MARPMRSYITRSKGGYLEVYRLSDRPYMDAAGNWYSKDGSDGGEVCEGGVRAFLGRLPRKGTKVLVSMTWEQVKE